MGGRLADFATRVSGAPLSLSRDVSRTPGLAVAIGVTEKSVSLTSESSCFKKVDAEVAMDDGVPGTAPSCRDSGLWADTRLITASGDTGEALPLVGENTSNVETDPSSSSTNTS